MSDKSYVTMEQHVCVVCGTPYATNNLLLDKRLRPRFERHTVTGYGMCDEHQALKDKGMVALIEVDPAKSNMKLKENDDRNTVVGNIAGAYRTGNVAHVKSELFADLFAVEVPKGMVCFIEPEVFEYLAKAVKEEGNG